MIPSQFYDSLFDCFLQLVQLAGLHMTCMPDIVFTENKNWYQISACSATLLKFLTSALRPLKLQLDSKHQRLTVVAGLACMMLQGDTQSHAVCMRMHQQQLLTHGHKQCSRQD